MVGDLDELFAGREAAVRETYDRIIAALTLLGPTRIEPKKTSIHLARRSAFAGVHPRKNALLLNIRSAAPIASARIRAREQVSKNRFHNELLLSSPAEVDDELMGWLREAYALSA
ncbi:MAG: DNA replication protein DnaC [Phenylobacterium sp.]|nr:MAG: DNA replication protein DnaC [Phenylobacterium sp.]